MQWKPHTPCLGRHEISIKPRWEVPEVGLQNATQKHITRNQDKDVGITGQTQNRLVKSDCFHHKRMFIKK